MDGRLIQVKDELKDGAHISPARDVGMYQILSKELKRPGPDPLGQLGVL